LAIQRQSGVSIDAAKQEALRVLGGNMPSQADFNVALISSASNRRVGRPRKVGGITKGGAVAALAVYFRSIGAKSEQSIELAKHWLNIVISRKVALAAVARYLKECSPENYKPNAWGVYQKVRGGTTLPLPESIAPAERKKRKPNLN
jgi:hypothetical protein